MEVKILKSTDSYLELEIQGEDHTLGNLLAGYLRRINGVKFASYFQPHPLLTNIILKILTDGKVKPLDALKTAIEMAEEDNNKFISEISKI
ncbi:MULTISPECIES: DNA-directed RNA polymerase subunit L [Acidianus]|uniref:DNA-directed RNA polymerase subunit Rpo11 n=1 Tax=Candidatus Acidianus copahuensis TaxID=1160895 RepID=A0A031LRC2_9CREN|nr:MULTISPECIES: DNA-directed RNA polymerase subunit L [Acidianus]EZQ06949.1 DNA-directed RNA polymerase subunit L [Candidatus Acidianus copahuensis]NON62356.1 DNA-directed RNA polymerase subunit L [Acidianus sp. RZ1]